jgi:DNA-binding HxlR family transcriptional regulator
MGILERRREGGFPGAVDFELSRSGRELLGVARVLESWLSIAPSGPVTFGTTAAKGTVKALVDGWSSGIVRALAARPLSLTELSSIIPRFSYPSLERRLGALRLSGQIEPCPGDGRRTPYQATEWLRLAMAPLLNGARWERRFLPERTRALTKFDFEAAFLLAVPMVCLASEEAGSCRLAVESRNANRERVLAGALVTVESGCVVSCVSRLQGVADSWAIGSPSAWLNALINGASEELEIGGDAQLARGLVESLHAFLFRAPQAVRSAYARVPCS